MNSELSLRERILADVHERKRLQEEWRRTRDHLVMLVEARRNFAAKAIAQRHRVKLRQVNAIAYSKREEQDHITEKTCLSA